MIVDWLTTVWLPEEAEHGRLTRRYVQEVWPEFAWDAGYEAFFKRYGPECDYQKLRPSPAL